MADPDREMLRDGSRSGAGRMIRGRPDNPAPLRIARQRAKSIMGLMAVHPFVRAAEWTEAAFHPAGQPKGRTLLSFPGALTQRTIQTDFGQHPIEFAGSFGMHSDDCLSLVTMATRLTFFIFSVIVNYKEHG